MKFFRLIWFACIVLLVSCQSNDGKQYKVGFSQPLTGDAWRQSMQDEMSRQLLLHEDIELIFKDANGNTSLQIEQIQALVDDGIDLLIVSPNEARPIQPIIESIYKKGVHVILLDRRINSDQYTAFVGADNRSIGREVARYLSLKGEAIRVLELYESLSITAFLDRHEGFQEQVANYPTIEVDTCRAMNKGRASYKRLLKSHRYDFVFAPTDVAAYYAYQIADSLGMPDGMAFIGIDGLPGEDGGLNYVEKGILEASFLYPTGGDVAIDLAADVLHGLPYQKENILQSTVIDANNVKLMQLQANKLLEQQRNIENLGNKLGVITDVFRTQQTLTYLFAAAMVISIVFGSYAFKALVDKRRTNQELKSINEKALAFSKQAEEATQQRLEFFTNISHEFRTPLTLMLSPLDELLSRKDSAHIRKEHSLIKANALRLLRLVNQIMDFRKIDAGRMQVRASESDLVAFVDDIVLAFQKVAEGKNIKLSFTHESRSVPLWYDRSMLDKVLFNLLSNAMKFTNSGGHIHVKMEHNQLEGQVLLVVEDSGEGMTQVDLANVFSRFYQGEQKRSLGTGIGLALSKEIIQLHDGEITVQSVMGKGTRFEIKLKTGKAHFDTGQLTTAVEEHIVQETMVIDFEDEATFDSDPTSKIIRDQTVLIIEDNKDLRGYLVRKLAGQYNILEADQVKDGIEKAFEEVPDLIICDLMLKKESGYDVIRTLKADVRSSHIPIVVLTAKASTEEKIMGVKMGADDYITKPFNYALLAERVAMLLANRQKLRDHYVSELPIETKTVSPSRLEKKFVNEFVALVEQNIGNADFGVNDICEGLGLSRIQLYRKVKAVLGYSVNDYINSVRLKKAKHLLGLSEHTISEIAHLVGYSSAAYFSTAFKNQFGISPSEYKQA